MLSCSYTPFMNRLITLVLVWCCLLMAHPMQGYYKASLHGDDFRAIFRGYWGDRFEELSEIINTGVDSELPKRYAEKQQMSFSPRNHRLIGHGWTMNAPIREDRMQKLLNRFPHSTKEDITQVWSQWSKEVTGKISEITGLQGRPAAAFASLLHNIHLLGDLVPDENTLIEDVLTPDEILKNLNRDVDDLFINNPKQADFIKQRLSKAMTKSAGESNPVKAQTLLNELREVGMGESMSSSWGKTLQKADEAARQQRLVRAAGQLAHNEIDCARVRSSRLGHSDFNAAKNGKVWRPAIITPNNKLLVLVKNIGGECVFLAIALDAATPTYNYLSGKCMRDEFVEDLVDSTIKGSAVGAATTVAVLLGAPGAGIVVYSLAIASYEIANLAIKVSRQKYLSGDDLETAGLQLDSILKIPHDTIFDWKLDTSLKLKRDSTEAWAIDSPLSTARHMSD